MTTLLRSFILICSFAFISNSYAAPEIPKADTLAPEQHPLTLQAKDLFAQINDKRAGVNVLKKQFEKASGDEKIALEIRLFQLKLDVLETLSLLTQNIHLQIESKIDIGGDKILLVSLLKKAGPAIQRYTDYLEKTLDRQHAKHPELDEKQLQIRKKNYNQLMSTYEALLSHILNLELMEMDAKPQRYFLANRIMARAEKLASLIEYEAQSKNRLQKRIDQEPDNKDYPSELLLIDEKLNAHTKNLAIISSVLGTLGKDRSRYQRLLLNTTGEITTDIFDRKLIASLVEQWRDKTRTFITDNGPTIVIQSGIFLLILLVFRILSIITGKVISKSVTSSKLNISYLLQEMIVAIASRLVMIIGVLMALSQIGVSLGPLLAGLGVVGFIIGFALQDTLGNFAAGMMILMYRPYDIGDLVETAGVFGSVKSMSLVSTTILTIDNQTLVIPNSKIWGDVIKNITAESTRRVDLVFSPAYNNDIDRLETLLKEIVSQHDKVLNEPAPTIKLHKLNEYSVDFIVRPWVNTPDYWDVYWDITRQVKLRFDQEGISTPLPGRNVHIINKAVTDTGP